MAKKSGKSGRESGRAPKRGASKGKAGKGRAGARHAGGEGSRRGEDVMHRRSFAGAEYASTEEEQTRDRRGESREFDRPDGTHGGGLAAPVREGEEGAPNPASW